MGINLFDLHIINCYGRHYDTKTKINYQKKFQEKLRKLSQQLKNQKLLIAGDFNLDNQQLNKLEFLEKSNLEILKNETSSRKRNIDHFISHSILFQNSTNSILQTPKIFQDETNLSDHKGVVNNLMINRDLEIEDVYMCKDPTIFQQKFIEIAQQNNFQLNQKKFYKFSGRIQNEKSSY
ncbi:secreted protein-related [Anaeramoeba flamelloides]|uniref:Secreted protein-related n=1 Tax=Anaeramoeba flamelloides TaxID=1746091 RepID=A0AAV8A7G5_9EUKA|nr:secreted protein-related [Anaeramoeba flamelloides]